MLRVHVGGLRQPGPGDAARDARAAHRLGRGHRERAGGRRRRRGRALRGGQGRRHSALVRSLAAEVAAARRPGQRRRPRPDRHSADRPPDSPWRAPAYLDTLPLRRLGTPEEVALCVAFLVEEATFCVGEVLNAQRRSGDLDDAAHCDGTLRAGSPWSPAPAQGMGAAHARRLAREGAVVGGQRPDRDDRTDARSPTRSAAFRVRRRRQRPRRRSRALVADVEATGRRRRRARGNHAYMTMAPFLEHDLDDWWKVVDTNLGGTVPPGAGGPAGHAPARRRTHRRGRPASGG